MKCEFGCGKEAEFQLKNGKWCCEDLFNRCEEVRRKNSNAKKNKQIPWNKGLKRINDKRIDDIFIKRRKTIKGKPGHKHSEQTKQKLRKIAIENGYGGLKEGSGRCKGFWYKSNIAGKVYIRGSYELEYVKYLDKNSIQWKGNKNFFLYEWKNKIRRYYPDFYLIETDEFVEIKGYKTEKDVAKWSQFPWKLKVLMKKELLEIGLKIK